MIQRLALAVLWLSIFVAHLTLVTLVLGALWLRGVTAADVTAACHQFLQSNTGETLAAFGLSAGAVLSGWLWMLKKLHKAIAKTALFDLLTHD